MRYVLNLDPNFKPFQYVTELDYTLIIFNGGELNPIINNTHFTADSCVTITNRCRNADDIMKILLSADALRRLGARNLDLCLPYIPYGRQDRVCNTGESLAIKVYAELINSCKFDSVTVVDPHSDVSTALINNCITISNKKYVEYTIDSIYEMVQSPITLISPDSGANKKVNKLFIDLLEDEYVTRLVKCDKVRDLKTGHLSGFEVFADDLNGAPCVIVDDICDGGGTFVGLAQELKKKNSGDLFLYVTHGIFSKGFVDLSKYFYAIYCTNSFMDVHNSNLVQFEISL